MATREVVSLYNQDLTHFDLRIYVSPDVETDGEIVVALAEEFMSTLILPGCRITSLWTRRPELDAKLNIGDFSDRRWKVSGYGVPGTDEFPGFVQFGSYWHGSVESFEAPRCQAP